MDHHDDLREPELLADAPPASAPAPAPEPDEPAEAEPVAFVLPASITADADDEPLPLLALTVTIGGRPVRLEADEPYVTADPTEISALDEHEHVERKEQ